MKVYLSRFGWWVWSVMAMLGFQSVLNAAVTVNPTNAFSSAEDGFNYGGGLGISLLTIAVVLGALMFGWRLKSGRGK